MVVAAVAVAVAVAALVVTDQAFCQSGLPGWLLSLALSLAFPPPLLV